MFEPPHGESTPKIFEAGTAGTEHARRRGARRDREQDVAQAGEDPRREEEPDEAAGADRALDEWAEEQDHDAVADDVEQSEPRVREHGGHPRPDVADRVRSEDEDLAVGGLAEEEGYGPLREAITSPPEGTRMAHIASATSCRTGYTGTGGSRTPHTSHVAIGVTYGAVVKRFGSLRRIEEKASRFSAGRMSSGVRGCGRRL